MGEEMNKIIENLCEFKGNYIGQGINHDNQEFKGALEISPLINGKGISIRFKAQGIDGEVYHEEETIIAPDDEGGFSLWTLNSNALMMYRHIYKESIPKRDSLSTLKFQYNQPDDASKFREIIELDLHKNGKIGYHYSWGMPGGDFKERSGLNLSKDV